MSPRDNEDENTPFLHDEEAAAGGNGLRSNRSSRYESRDNMHATWHSFMENKSVSNALRLFIAIALVVLFALMITILVKDRNGRDAFGTNVSISPESVRYGFRQCKKLESKDRLREKYFKEFKEEIQANKDGSSKYPKKRRNPRAEKNIKPVVIRAVTIWDGMGKSYKSDILIRDGIIEKIERFITIPKDSIVINGKNRIITPGLIDMHSHIGVDSWPNLKGTDDTNEMTQPTTPMVKTLDAFNPNDLALPRVMSGGITTTLVLPGSGNLMGGEAFVFKLRPIANLSNEAALVNAGLDEDSDQEISWRYMKFACGENPKRVYGSMDKMPSTRLGSGYLMRELFSKASRLVREQDNWCNYLNDNFQDADIRKGLVTTITKEFPEDVSLESLSNVIRGNVQPHIHCYEPEDLEMVTRLSEEYRFQIWAFHHALEAYRVPDLVKRAGRHGFNVTVATFADGWGYKKEAYNGTPDAPLILANHGIPVSFKSDHPVINSQQLMFEATKAYHNGLDAKHALEAVTSVPAKALGLYHRIGRVQQYMDADLVLWEDIPLSVGASPVQVIIDGILQIGKHEDDVDRLEALTEEDYLNPIPYPTITDHVESYKKNKDLCDYNDVKSFILSGLEMGIINKPSNSTKSKERVQTLSRKALIVIDGVIKEILDDDMMMLLSISRSKKLEIITLSGKAWMIPGLIGVGTKLGLNEIIQEESTGDGSVNDIDPLKFDDYPFAKDGLRFGGKHLERANKGGITAAVSSPLVEGGMVSGFSTAFFTDGDTAFLGKDVVKSITSLNLAVGQEYLTKSIPTISSQFLKLRQLFKLAIESGRKDWPKENSPMGQVIKGNIPVVVKADNADDISRLISMRNEIRDLFHQSGGFGNGLNLVILGGAESHLVADQLASEDVPIILQPVRCVPDTWSRRRCLSGPPLTNETTFTSLHKKGVTVGFASDEDGEYAADLIWEASWAYVNSRGDLSEIDAIALVSWNLQDIFKLNDNPFIIYDQSPLKIGSKLLAEYHPKKGWTCRS